MGGKGFPELLAFDTETAGWTPCPVPSQAKAEPLGLFFQSRGY